MANHKTVPRHTTVITNVKYRPGPDYLSTRNKLSHKERKKKEKEDKKPFVR